MVLNDFMKEEEMIKRMLENKFGKICIFNLFDTFF